MNVWITHLETLQFGSSQVSRSKVLCGSPGLKINKSSGECHSVGEYWVCKCTKTWIQTQAPRERKEVEMQLAAGLYSFGCSEKAISLPFAASKGHPPACLGLWTSARWVLLSDSSTFLSHFLLRTPAIALDSAKWSCYAPLTPIRISRFAAVHSTCKQNCFHPTQCTRAKNLRLGQTGWDAILLSTPSFFS